MLVAETRNVVTECEEGCRRRTYQMLVRQGDVTFYRCQACGHEWLHMIEKEADHGHRLRR